MTEFHDATNVTNPEHAEHHVVTPRTYIFVFITLLIFTGLTVVAAYVDLGILNPVVALAIASFKAIVVILFFMHVKFQSRLIKLTVASGFFTFLVLTTMTLSERI
jgi:cytochrome c oxidase subunit 4